MSLEASRIIFGPRKNHSALFIKRKNVLFYFLSLCNLLFEFATLERVARPCNMATCVHITKLVAFKIRKKRKEVQKATLHSVPK